ncbi:ferredoxin [Limnochorda pilosa]|uniref:Ferredoxin n=1 Tax=Limnochorda pilosa TaxID=1555112 RepID=A0A0K2SHZ9_LIMPI|nr:ferredoxin [Limnochorda pilosa]
MNGHPVEAPAGANLLEVLRSSGFPVPSLCYLEGLPGIGACRLCLVELAGDRRLQASCATRVREGMEVLTHSPRVLEARRAVLQLMLAGHPNDCLFCQRSDDCDLQALARQYGVRSRDYETDLRPLPPDPSSPSIAYDPQKCLLCQRCVRTCSEVQGVEAIGLVRRGMRMQVSPPFGLDWAKSGCTYCGQCTLVCPTGALTEKDDVSRVWEALEDPTRVVVAQIAPAVRVSVGEAWARGREPDGSGIPADVSGRLVSALKAVGFHAVFDTQFGADLTIMEETHELLARLGSGKELPLFTSCCPAWVRFVELHFPDQVHHLSSCRSPQGMMGSLLRRYYPRLAGVDPERVTVVSIMPCTAKKYEATRPELGTDGRSDVDIVLTTRELSRLLRQAGVDPGALPPKPFDDPLGESTGAAAIFGASGGVAEAALREAYHLATGQTAARPEFHLVRGWDDLRAVEFDLNGTQVRCAVVSGLKGARRLLETGEYRSYDFVEVMACPGGCIDGGGQPRHTPLERVQRRGAGLDAIDSRKPAHTSHENETIQRVYRDLLGEPGSVEAHHLLHTSYTPLPLNELLLGGDGDPAARTGGVGAPDEGQAEGEQGAAVRNGHTSPQHN